MKKSTILAIASMIILGFAANSFAADLFGYPVVEKQIRFYSLILGIIAISAVLVAVSCLSSRVADVKKRSARLSEEKAFGTFAAATQSAK